MGNRRIGDLRFPPGCNRRIGGGPRRRCGVRRGRAGYLRWAS